MGGFLDALKGRKKQIDEAAPEDTTSAPTSSITIDHPAATVTVTPKSSSPAGQKWDDWAQKYVPESEWKSPQEHERDERVKAGRGR